MGILCVKILEKNIAMKKSTHKIKMGAKACRPISEYFCLLTTKKLTTKKMLNKAITYIPKNVSPKSNKIKSKQLKTKT
jgi:hypothetical protein